ncbi:MAG: hypothetical protein E2586_06025 [Novosphingobium sp.]|nr:hypothetical protein [Novosphingobium sp.]
MPKVFDSIRRTTRASDWWDYKLLVIVSLFPATLICAGQPVLPHWRDAILLILSLVSGAIFASIVNDLCDREEDLRAGKSTLATRPVRMLAAAMLVASIATGAAFLFAWRDDLPLCIAYACAWLAFLAYSVPPFRLKKRASGGIIVVALGEATLPTLVALLLACRSADLAIDPVWLGAVAVWSLAHGMRAILWHQLRDLAADQVTGVETFVVKHGAMPTRQLASWIVMPAEVAGLAIMMVKLGGVIPACFLAVYGIVLWLRRLLWHNVPVVIAPLSNHILLLQDYYLGFLPAAIFLSGVLRHPSDVMAWAAFLLLFPRAPLRIFGDLIRLLQQYCREVALR